MQKIISAILGFLWPPYGFELKKRKFLSEEKARYSYFYKNHYLPALEKHKQDILDNFEKELECKKLLR